MLDKQSILSLISVVSATVKVLVVTLLIIPYLEPTIHFFVQIHLT